MNNTDTLNALKENADQAAQVLKAMSNRNRLMILCILLDKELAVGQLNQQIPLSQSSLSQHLSALKKSGLVSTRRESQTIFYRIEGEISAKIISILKDTFCT